ncbi:zinc finger BED domain-containing protein 4-like [Scomber japonicus]|uniref:zinc finger BED domain-containing protein 4-like n=1 Tax=Scomber japonicus TaxID=13676 RepID=UPI002306C54E|nr:zinc finger BED domain-containing protein 4-like [Scomber japonicus]
MNPSQKLVCNAINWPRTLSVAFRHLANQMQPWTLGPCMRTPGVTKMAEAGGEHARDAEETLVPKTNSTSAIWQYFGFKKEDNLQSQVLCRTCRAVVATSRGNTTNLHHHLLHHHKELHEQFKASQSRAPSSSKATRPSLQQQSIAQSFVRLTPYEKSSKRHIEITEAITHCLAKDMMPTNTVTRPGFLSLVHKLDRRYEVPSRTYFSDVAIPNLYEKCRTTVESELDQVEYFACTTDLWSSRTTEPYISLTVHFLDREFQLKTRCLQTQYFPGEHTGENIAYGLREALTSWHLGEEQLTCVTTDNGANVVKAIELNHWVRLQCFGHRLHLAIENALKDDRRIARATGLCKKMVGHFSHSWKQKTALRRAQQKHNLPEHALVTECPTRWGSKQKMMGRILEQQRALSDVLSADRKTRHLDPSWQDLETSVLAGKEGDTDLTKDIKFKSSYISVEKVQDIKTRVMSEMKDTSQKEGEDSQAKSVNPPIDKRAKPSLGSLLKSNPGPTSTTFDMQMEQAIEAEVNSYLLSPTIDSEADPLTWWKLHHLTYPKLSKLARRYLCIPATSSPSERLFSTSGNVVTCQRACLKPTKVNMLVFLAKNLP